MLQRPAALLPLGPHNPGCSGASLLIIPARSALHRTLPPTRCQPHPRLDLNWPAFNPPLHHIIISHSESMLSKPFQGWTACGYWGVHLPCDITDGGGVSVNQTGSRERTGMSGVCLSLSLTRQMMNTPKKLPAERGGVRMLRVSLTAVWWQPHGRGLTYQHILCLSGPAAGRAERVTS